METLTFEQLTDNTPDFAQSVVDLWRWSVNYDAKTQTPPMRVFLDLIGYSAEHFGEPLATNCELDFVSADYVADALKTYAVRPSDTYEIVTTLLAGER